MTLNVDPKQVFIIPKFYGGIISAMFSLGIVIFGWFLRNEYVRRERLDMEFKQELLELRRTCSSVNTKIMVVHDILRDNDKDTDEKIFRYSARYESMTTRSVGTVK